MAFRLARMGAMVLVPDNIGQGEREPMGHRHVVEVFAHGLSLQGLIAMESIGWVRWLKKDRRVDVARIAAIGQSGGGTLTLMLAALCREDLTALSCSGYPSWFAFIAAKRKKHCHCNVLPGIVGELAMWHVLACFAPRPMYIFQGNRDRYFPHTTYFRETAEKLKDVYGRLGAGENFRGEVFAGAHSWDTARRRSLAAFLKGVLGLPGEVEHADPRIADPPGECLAEWPRDALSADDVAATLSGLPRARCRHLADVFPPASPEKGPRRKLTLQIFAQYEAFLRRRP